MVGQCATIWIQHCKCVNIGQKVTYPLKDKSSDCWINCEADTNATQTSVAAISVHVSVIRCKAEIYINVMHCRISSCIVTLL